MTSHFHVKDEEDDLPPAYSEDGDTLVALPVSEPQESSVVCPMCRVQFPASLIQEHADQCSAHSDFPKMATRVTPRQAGRRNSANLRVDPPPARISTRESPPSPLSKFNPCFGLFWFWFLNFSFLLLLLLLIWIVVSQIRLESLKERAKVDIFRVDCGVKVWLATAAGIHAKVPLPLLLASSPSSCLMFFNLVCRPRNSMTSARPRRPWLGIRSMSSKRSSSFGCFFDFVAAGLTDSLSTPPSIVSKLHKLPEYTSLGDDPELHQAKKVSFLIAAPLLCLSVCLSVCLFVCLSVCLFVLSCVFASLFLESL